MASCLLQVFQLRFENRQRIITKGKQTKLQLATKEINSKAGISTRKITNRSCGIRAYAMLNDLSNWADIKPLEERIELWRHTLLFSASLPRIDQIRRGGQDAASIRPVHRDYP